MNALFDPWQFEVCFFEDVLLKNHLWLVLIENEILITMGIGWSVSSDKWKAALGSHC